MQIRIMMITTQNILWFNKLTNNQPVNKNLLEQALTHDSISKKAGGKGKSNERLEFLGDRILGLIIAESLFKLYPQEKEGELARRLAWLASKDVLYQVAKKIKLDENILMAYAEENAGGRNNPAILSDACEALLAYFYLELGIDFCRQFINQYWHEFLHKKAAPKDAKSALQEWAQKNGYELPQYSIISHTGPDHKPEFVIAVKAGKYQEKATAESKKKAERLAAQKLLKKLGYNQ